MATTQLPSRSNTEKHGGYISDDDAVPANDPSDTTSLLTERLQAWKHMCGYLENYIAEVAKDQKSQAKDQEKMLKTLSHPLKEGHHFDQALGGIAGLFENLRANTQAQSNLHIETSKNLTGSVLPILERLHAEVKNKNKELASGAGKGAKAVDHARNTSQKHIELLGQHTASFDSTGGKVTASNDPYVLQKGVFHRLNKQLIEENNNRSDLISVQNSFQQFEAHVISTVQSAMSTFNQYMSGQADRQKALYGDMSATASHIPLDFEWNGFLRRNGDKLISPNAPARTMDTVTFPNHNHRATKALIEGSLEKKGRLTGYKSGYYAVTPAGYLHEYKDNDNFRHEPTPETSLYLPDCVIGAVDGTKFSIKGKDSSGGKLSQKMSMTSEYNFKAHTPADAAQWHNVIAMATSGTSNSVPVSPVDGRNITPIMTNTSAMSGSQQTGVAGSAVPHSATSTTAPYSAGVPQSATSQTAPHTIGTIPETSVPHTAPGVAPTTGGYHGSPTTNELEPRKY